MDNLAGVVRLLKKEQDRLTKELRGIGAALAAFGNAYGQRTGTRKLSASGRATNRGRPKSALGKGSGNGANESCSDTWEADTLGSCAKEDRRCAEGAMGEGEGREKRRPSSPCLKSKCWVDGWEVSKGFNG